MHFQNFGALSKFRCTFKISMHFQNFDALSKFLCTFKISISISGGNVFFKVNFSEVFYPKCIFAKCTRLACLLSFASFSNKKYLYSARLAHCSFCERMYVPFWHPRAQGRKTACIWPLMGKLNLWLV